MVVAAAAAWAGWVEWICDEENGMPKGQQRSNREPKKPKQSKLKPVPVSPFAVTQVKPAAPVPGKKK